MNDFYQKIDQMFKEHLDHPVPALLLEENKKYIQTYVAENTPVDSKVFIKNFLLAQGYTLLSDQPTSGYDFLMHYNKDNNPRNVKFKVIYPENFDTHNHPYFNLSIEERPDYGVILLLNGFVQKKPSLAFVKPDHSFREVII